MREIKFRAWNGKEMISNYAHVGENGRMYTIHHTGKEPDYKVMQHTGLKDKNGKEIYEGDLIRITEIDEDSAFGQEYTEVVEVKWIEKIAQFRAVFTSGRRTELHLVVQPPTVISCEVIGNIYENPELLTPQINNIN